MGAKTCFFDRAECTFLGECMGCDRFPGTEEAKALVTAKQDPVESLVKARDVTQIDPSQYVARVVLQWDDAIYALGPSPDVAIAMADFEFRKAYDFAVRYHEFITN